MPDTNLYIDQIVKQTIQGEGNRIGYPSTLIRVSGCNLKCSFCDSKHTWKKERKQFINETTFDTFIKQINSYKMKNIMLTGGEPFIYSHISLFWKLLQSFKSKLEIETNGSLITSDDLILIKQLGIHLNLSPKLDINFYKNKEEYSNLFSTYWQIFKSLKKEQYIIKFVYTDDYWDDIKKFIKNTKCDKSRVYLMSFTPDISKFNNDVESFNRIYKESVNRTLKKCLSENLNFSPREHIGIFGFDRNEKLSV